jgi:hypothetical protein
VDESHFDALNLTVAQDTSRRTMVRGLLGSALGAVMSALGAPTAHTSARPKRRGAKGRRKGGILACHSGEEPRAPRYVVRAILRDGGRLGPCHSGNPPV